MAARPAPSAGDDNSAAPDESCQSHTAVHRERAFPHVLESVRDARHFVVGVVESRYGARVARDAAIVVTELAANAFQHAGSRFTVSVECPAGEVAIAVRDHGPLNGGRRLPTPRGHGLDVVSQIARSWGADPVPDGKVVWARLPAAA